MQSIQRTALRSARRVRPQLQKQSRRWETQGAEPHNYKAEGGGPSVPNESFGPGFYIAIAAIPASFALFKLSGQGSDEQPWATRYIVDTYNSYAEKWARRNDLHTQALEQAASDRLLFLNESSNGPRHVDVRFPESLNGGSPWNVPAGHGSANIDRVIQHFEKEAYEENEKKLQQLRDNKVPCEMPYESPLTKSPPAPPSGA